ncbi:HlyD family secretion protein [Kineobactrum sediminis]|nr:HlyD family secretion protein [Kineobactrum sediminis]
MTIGLKRNLGMGLGIALAIALGLWFSLGGRNSVSTENAYIKAGKLALAGEVSSVIKTVLVAANQPVSQGQLLVQLEDQPFRLAVSEAEAHLAQVRNQILGRRADYAEIEAELQQARQDADYYQRQLARNQNLGPAAISESQLDESRQLLTRSRARIAINLQKLASLRAALGGGPDVALAAQADIQVAQAQLDRALYQLSRTRIEAPVDGVIANDVPQAGEMSPAGFSLISMLDTSELWVEANLKETQLEHIRPGQTAEVKIDAYPGQRLRAEVASLSAASGSEFAMIPAQNASGNWVKVVQRIPVRLRLLQTEGAPVLRAGMSAEVHIDVSSARANSAKVGASAIGGADVAAIAP